MPNDFIEPEHQSEPYTGNQQFRGNGIMRFCALCGGHKATGGGHLQFVLGARQWVCKQHKKPGVSK